MDEGMIGAAHAMTGMQRQLDVAVLNLANTRTPGWQPRVAVSRTFDAELADAEGEPGLPHVAESVSFEQGLAVPSDNPYGVALLGPGFFEIETDAGAAFTRSGDFSFEGDTLVTRGGYPVVGSGGRIKRDPAGGPVTIDETGALRQADRTLGKLRVVEFADTSKLTAVGDTAFAAGEGAGPTPITKPEIAPGMVEIPQDRAVGGLVQLITIHRAYDAAERVLTQISDSYERLHRQQG